MRYCIREDDPGPGGDIALGPDPEVVPQEVRSIDCAEDRGYLGRLHHVSRFASRILAALMVGDFIDS